jgi:hypothetical protein
VRQRTRQVEVFNSTSNQTDHRGRAKFIMPPSTFV